MTPSLPAQIHVPDLRPHPDEARRASYAAARLAFGAALIAGLGAAALSAWMGPSPVLVLPLAWLAAAVIAAAAAGLARAGILAPPPLTTSWAVLFAGIACIAPLSLHLVVDAPAWAPLRCFSGPGFAAWTRSTCLLAGPAHVVFAALCARRAARLARLGAPASGLGKARPRRIVVVAAPMAVTLAIDCIGFGPYGVLPALYVGVTGAVIVGALSFLEAAVVRSAIPQE